MIFGFSSAVVKPFHCLVLHWADALQPLSRHFRDALSISRFHYRLFRKRRVCHSGVRYVALTCIAGKSFRL
jgi:hypothetical protein